MPALTPHASSLKCAMAQPRKPRPSAWTLHGLCVYVLAFASAAFDAANALCLFVVRSLADNDLCGAKYIGGTYTTEGINALCEALKSTTTLTSLKYASQLESLPTVNSL